MRAEQFPPETGGGSPPAPSSTTHQTNTMKNKIVSIATLVIGLLAFELVIILVTSLYWQHKAVVHHAAFFEASSWGNVSFHWEDDSYAHTPFQDGSVFDKINQDNFQKKLDSIGAK